MQEVKHSCPWASSNPGTLHQQHAAWGECLLIDPCKFVSTEDKTKINFICTKEALNKPEEEKLNMGTKRLQILMHDWAFLSYHPTRQNLHGMAQGHVSGSRWGSTVGSMVPTSGSQSFTKAQDHPLAFWTTWHMTKASCKRGRAS